MQFITWLNTKLVRRNYICHKTREPLSRSRSGSLSLQLTLWPSQSHVCSVVLLSLLPPSVHTTRLSFSDSISFTEEPRHLFPNTVLLTSFITTEIVSFYYLRVHIYCTPRPLSFHHCRRSFHVASTYYVVSTSHTWSPLIIFLFVQLLHFLF